MVLEVPNPRAFWEELSNHHSKFYYSRKYTSNFIKDSHWLLQHTIARSISERDCAYNRINQMDFLCLYGMIKKVLVSPGFVIANMFMSHHNVNILGIYIGPYLTTIVKGNQRLKIKEKPIASMTKITVEMIAKIIYSKTKMERETKRRREESSSDEEEEEPLMEDASLPTLQPEEDGTSATPSRERTNSMGMLMTEILGLRELFSTKMMTMEGNIIGINERLKNVEATVQNINTEVQLLRSSASKEVPEMNVDDTTNT